MGETKPAVQSDIELKLKLEPDPVRAPATVEHEAPQAQTAMSPIDKVTHLLNRGVTMEQLDQFLEMQKKWEAEEARKAYHAAMADFKCEDIPEILKRHRVNYSTKDHQGHVNGEVNYSHEELFDVVDAVLEPMAKHGLTHKWVPSQQQNMITVRCVVTHRLGHSDSVELYAAPDSSGRKNPIQQVKSTISYLERITLLAITGLAAKGMDNDAQSFGDPPPDMMSSAKPQTSAPRASRANGSGTELASSKQVGLLETRCRNANVSPSVVLAEFGLNRLEDMPKAKVTPALDFIKANAQP